MALRARDPKKFEAVARGQIKANAVLKDLRRTERTRKLAAISRGNKPLTSPVLRYPIVLADPPWRYEHVKTESRAIENQYPTMDTDAICAMPIQKLVTDDAVLFLWAPSPKLEEAMRVIRAWGFVPKTSMVWVKDRIGMGYYVRAQHELLLIATRGEPPTPPESARPSSVIEAPVGAHSVKPVAAHEAIERMYPELPKLELFARKQRAGWQAWGNQAERT